MKIRRAADRGQASFGWLQSQHTFSFGEYHDPEQMGFGPLRVINEDRVEAGRGFATHAHKDMEILSYVLEGALEHRDSLGNGSVIRPGDLQRMSAGTGIRHSEFNESSVEPLHFLQIWIVPAKSGRAPGYEQNHFPADQRRGQLRLIASQDGREGSVTIQRDVDVFASILAKGEAVEHLLLEGRKAWIQVLRGSVSLDDQPLEAGDGAALDASASLRIEGRSSAEVLLFDMA